MFAPAQPTGGACAAYETKPFFGPCFPERKDSGRSLERSPWGWTGMPEYWVGSLNAEKRNEPNFSGAAPLETKTSGRDTRAHAPGLASQPEAEADRSVTKNETNPISRTIPQTAHRLLSNAPGARSGLGVCSSGMTRWPSNPGAKRTQTPSAPAWRTTISINCSSAPLADLTPRDLSELFRSMGSADLIPTRPGLPCVGSRQVAIILARSGIPGRMSGPPRGWSGMLAGWPGQGGHQCVCPRRLGRCPPRKRV